MYKKIEWQQQSTPDCCSHACVAMWKGIDQSEVIEEFPEPGSNLQIRQMLAFYQVPVMDVPVLLFLNIPGYYFLAISGNTAHRHSVLVRVLEDDDMLEVWDPLTGPGELHPAELGDVTEALLVLPEK